MGCDAIRNGELWSTFGPKGDLLPGKPLKTASCPAHTLWAWCWGAPCSKASGKLICDCPMMESTNDANQSLSLAGDGECPPALEDPCTTATIHNSMPAGTAPASHLPDSSANQCYP